MHYLVCLTRVSLLLPAANLLGLEIDLQVNQRVSSWKDQSIFHPHIVHYLHALILRAICMAEGTPPGTRLGWSLGSWNTGIKQCLSDMKLAFRVA